MTQQPNDRIVFAEVAWKAADIQTYRPEWSVEQCEDFLAKIERVLEDRMIEVGWDVIENELGIGS